MKKLLLMMLMPLATLSAWAQGNDYNMVIELKNGTTVTLGANDVENLTFNGGSLSVSGNTIEDIYAQIEELRAMIGQLQENAEPAVRTFNVNGVTFRMIKVKGGTFQMGASEELATNEDQKPAHSVTLSDFYIAETEVTQELYKAVMDSKYDAYSTPWNSTLGIGDDYPAYMQSWGSGYFLSALNELTGLSFRLPTEAEWEFAARGGNESGNYRFAGGDYLWDLGWYRENCQVDWPYEYATEYGYHLVKDKYPNELGLYDMSGNVPEWCSDWYGPYGSSAQTNPTGPSNGSERVLRGGDFTSTEDECTVFYREKSDPSSAIGGLRLVLSTNF